MEGIDGFTVAQTVRRQDENAIIIFITSNREMMQKAFDVRAFNYLLKMDDTDRIEQVIRKAITYENVRKSCFEYRKKAEQYTIRNEDIYYFESKRRKMCITMPEGEDEFYDTVDNVLKRLNPLLFVQIHKSYIVNLEYVERMDSEQIVLRNGTELKVTNNYRTIFNTKYRNFVMSRMG